MSQTKIENWAESTLEDRPFPRGFLLTQRPHSVPAGYKPGPILTNFSIDKLTEVSHSSCDNHFVILLGLAFHEGYDSAASISEALVRELVRGETKFFSELKKVAGRYAVIYGGPGFLRVVSDATATRSIFYAEEGGCIASHAQLVAMYRDSYRQIDPLKFMNGFPGNFTPFRGVRILTANMVCDLWDCTTQRYWPSKKISPRTVDEVAEATLTTVASNLKKAAQIAPLKIALTAGFDSRVILACALEAAVPFETFTYGKPVGGTEVDHKVAKHLAGVFGFSHTSVRSKPLNPTEEANFRATSYTNNHMLAAKGLEQFFGSPRSIGVNGNLFELARDHYGTVRHYENEYSGAELMTRMYYHKLSPKFKKRIASSTRSGDYIRSLEPYFAEWLKDVGGFAGGFFPPVTQFYWEHRMAAWNGPFTLERDFYSNFLVPFNSHQIFELFLATPENERFDRAIPYALMKRVDSRLTEIPINPPSFGRT